jgi:hypothetical protein
VQNARRRTPLSQRHSTKKSKVRSFPNIRITSKVKIHHNNMKEEKYIPGIFGEKSTLAKRMGPVDKKKYKKAPDYKPTGAALALSKKLLGK